MDKTTHPQPVITSSLVLTRESLAIALRKRAETGEFDPRAAEMLKDLPEFLETISSLSAVTGIDAQLVGVLFGAGVESALQAIEYELFNKPVVKN